MTALSAAVPAGWAQRLGYAGLLPFVLLAMVTWVTEPGHRGVAVLALTGYGAVIASFLGAIHWGLVMRDASKQSLWMAVCASGLASVAGLTMALAVAGGVRAGRWVEMAAMLPMAASGLVLGTGLFLVIRPVVAPETLAVPVTVLVNAAMALPFLFRLLLPEARALHLGYDPLCRTLGLRGWGRLRYVTLPRLARPLGLGSGIAAALSMGDLGVIALFAGDHGATLPLMVQRLAGAYRMDQAAAAALLLVTLSFALFTLCDLGGRHAAP